jgi:opacity protein-like surface antigen
MRKLVSVAMLVIGLCLAAAAADAPKAEIFGGVSWLHIDNMGVSGIKTNYMGWDSEFQYNLKKWLGATADIGGNYGHVTAGAPMSHTYTFVFGPTLTHRGNNATFFAHTLFGANKTDLFSGGGSSNSNTAFAMAFGGGLDLKISNTFALRLGQLDWLYTRHNLASSGLKDFQNNIRYAGGVVINFGD